MRIGIVLKLFLLTTTLCMTILAVIYVGQTIFFKDYYANRKVAGIQAGIANFETQSAADGSNSLSVRQLEQNFYRDNSTWITTLDRYGNLKNSDNFYLEVAPIRRVSEIQTYKIPLYNMMSLEDISDASILLAKNEKVLVSGVVDGSNFTPVYVQAGDGAKIWRNGVLSKRVDEINRQIKEEYVKEMDSRKKKEALVPQEKRKTVSKGDSQTSVELQPDPIAIRESPATVMNAVITGIKLPDPNEATDLLFANSLFMERIQQFQAGLLFDEAKEDYSALRTVDYEQNNVKYKLFIHRVAGNDGEPSYIFAMASLQPVDEAVQMVKDYYVYIVLFVLVLILLASLYYSMKIARPLLRMNQTTKKLAALDFTETIPVRSKDEIGDLSRNINSLSGTLHSYIGQLRQDIEKEKQLESTRKEFISGVSHELKTPLSVLKSCISILKDNVASHKRDYYFEAMEKEVDKMDLLIVDMLELAKFESGTYKMKMDVFSIDKAIESICEQLALDITGKKLEVRTQLVPFEVAANQHRIEQVITNFMTNAIRYTPEEQRIIVSTIEEGDRVIVCVENKGAHIPEEQLDKIWDRFYRGDSARQREHGGTGLGLAISKNILELHGAEYGAMNTEDGVAFYFYLNKKG